MWLCVCVNVCTLSTIFKWQQNGRNRCEKWNTMGQVLVVYFRPAITICSLAKWDHVRLMSGEMKGSHVNEQRLGYGTGPEQWAVAGGGLLCKTIRVPWKWMHEWNRNTAYTFLIVRRCRFLYSISVFLFSLLSFFFFCFPFVFILIGVRITVVLLFTFFNCCCCHVLLSIQNALNKILLLLRD